ncbi:MAG: YihY/virulence factor BrkB family protein [Maricaulaceae bacterium]
MTKPRASFRARFTNLRRFKIVRLLAHIRKSLSDKNVTLVAGGVAFYAFLSIFPTIACILMVWGMVTTVGDLSGALLWLEDIAPQPVYEIISGQMIHITQRETSASLWSAILTFFIAIWSASQAVTVLFTAMEVMYNAAHKRRYRARKLLALIFTLAGISFVVFSILLIGAVPPALEALRLGAIAEAAVLILRWILILGFFFVGGCAFYFVTRQDPKQAKRPESNKMIPGALAASLIWLVASMAFSYYLTAFKSYNEVFGSLGAVAALLIWLWVSAFALLVGAQINAGLDDKAIRRMGLTE